MNDRHIVTRLFAGLMLVVAMLPPVTADGYDPIPKGWGIKIGMPGMLSVGAEYCTQTGKCLYVGEDIVGFSVAGTQPGTRTAIGGVQGCQMMPNAEPCQKAKIPVDVLALSPAGSVIVRLKGENYAVTPSEKVSVVYHGTAMTLMDYQACFPPPGSTYTYIGPPAGKPRCSR
jgi:hypothetical protein